MKVQAVVVTGDHTKKVVFDQTLRKQVIELPEQSVFEVEKKISTKILK